MNEPSPPLATDRLTHTPGPWQVSGMRQSAGNYKGHMVGPDGDGVVVVPYNDKDHFECMANARLIAAAPDLLEVLRKVRDQIDDPHMGSVDHQSDVALVSAIRVAVAKAEGRS